MVPHGKSLQHTGHKVLTLVSGSGGMYDNVPREWVHSRDEVLVAEMGSQLYFQVHCSKVLLKNDHVHQLHQNPATKSGHAS